MQSPKQRSFEEDTSSMTRDPRLPHCNWLKRKSQPHPDDSGQHYATARPSTPSQPIGNTRPFLYQIHTRPTPSCTRHPANDLPRQPTSASPIPNTTHPIATPPVSPQDPPAQSMTSTNAHVPPDPRTASASDPDNPCTFGLTKKPR